ncbi:MAG TPA: hypothetical protein VHO69_09025 [Phototrophicaceae bacterium]|nr:hypothetical protein [Phototrophicaceae bacterium]
MRKQQQTIIGPDGELLTPDQNIDFAEYTEFVQERGSHAMWDAPRKEGRPPSVRYWALIFVAVIGGLTLLSKAREAPNGAVENSRSLGISGTPLPYLDKSGKTLFTDFDWIGDPVGNRGLTAPRIQWGPPAPVHADFKRNFLPRSHSQHRPLFAPATLTSSPMKKPLQPTGK